MRKTTKLSVEGKKLSFVKGEPEELLRLVLSAKASTPVPFNYSEKQAR